MSSVEDHLKRIGELEDLLKQVQTIAARGGDYGPVMKVLELWLPEVTSEKIILEHARDIERDLMERKESLTAQKAECDKREAAIASREAKIAERESTLEVQVNDILPAEMRKLQLATDRIEDSAASFADSTIGTASNLADSTRDTASNIAELKAAVESMKDEQATQRQQQDVLERRYAEKERPLAEQEQRHLEKERLLAEQEQRHLERERRLAEAVQRHLERERRLAEAEQRHAKAEQGHAEKEKRLLEKEQTLSRIRDALSEQSMEQQRLLQEQNATFHAQWSNLAAERKTMVEIRRNAKLYVEEYINRHNQVATSIDENVVGVEGLRAQIEEAKVQVARNRENHAIALLEARNFDDELQVTVARLASCRRDRQSLMMQWAESSTIFPEAFTLPSRQPQFTEMQQHGHGEPSPRRKRALPVSSTDTSPQKPVESKRARSESTSPRQTRHISPVFGRGRQAPAQAALEGGRLPLSGGSIRRHGGSTRGRSQGASRRPGLLELGVQSPEVGPAQQGKETSATFSAAGASASPLTIPEAGQGLWSQLTLDIEGKARKVLADLLFKKPSKTAKGKASQRPIPILTRGANSKTPMCLTSLLKAINPSNFGGRDGREACDNCKALHPCLRVSWKNIGGAEADDYSKEWRIEKRPPRP
ncbi:MAG: hypothetical protein L6R36_002551 [Xanthoria steineri]|nr:MAG: hypothetical protein L6R36_002551 [Xanthoria steineri]